MDRLMQLQGLLDLRWFDELHSFGSHELASIENRNHSSLSGGHFPLRLLFGKLLPIKIERGDKKARVVRRTLENHILRTQRDRHTGNQLRGGALGKANREHGLVDPLCRIGWREGKLFHLREYGSISKLASGDAGRSCVVVQHHGVAHYRSAQRGVGDAGHRLSRHGPAHLSWRVAGLHSRRPCLQADGDDRC